MYKHTVLNVLMWGIMSGCNSPSDNGGLEVRLEYQKASETSVYMIPVLHLSNNGTETLYAYFKPYGYDAVIDTLKETVELNFTVHLRTAPDGSLYTLGYDPPEPLILEIDPAAILRVHSVMITPQSTWELIRSGYGVYATIGYLTEEEMFVGKTGAGLSENILENQDIISSPEVVLSDFYKAP